MLAVELLTGGGGEGPVPKHPARIKSDARIKTELTQPFAMNRHLHENIYSLSPNHMHTPVRTCAACNWRQAPRVPVGSEADKETPGRLSQQFRSEFVMGQVCVVIL
jgi:hypothetical protein